MLNNNTIEFLKLKTYNMLKKNKLIQLAINKSILLQSNL